MSEPKQYIFRSVVADELRAAVKRNKGLEKYYDEDISFEEDETWPLRVELIGDTPELSPSREDDPLNACKLYAYLQNLDETQASDKRLWTYLAHVPFRKYVQQRWPLPHKVDDLRISDVAKKDVRSSILLHWFLNSNDSRALKRHALARLWWAARLTYAPWKYSNDFKELEVDDEYLYTRFIMSNETLYTEVAERVLGSSRHILIAFLEYFMQNPEALNRKNLRPIVKEISMISGIKKLSTLNYKQIYGLINSVANDIIKSD